MKTSWLVASLTCLHAAACTRDTATDNQLPQPAISPSSSASDNQPWTIDGKGVELHSALALGTKNQRSWRLSLSSGPLSCEQLSSAYPDTAPADDKHPRLDMWLVQSLEKDGRNGPWSFRSAFFSDQRGGRNLRAQGSLLKNVAHDGQDLLIDDLELALQDRRAGQLIAYSGKIEAKACPRIKRKEADKPQPKFTLRVAQTELPIRGATLRPEGKHMRLRLTSVPHDCRSTFTQGYDWYLDFVLEDKPPRVKLVSLQGDRFLDNPARSKDLESISATIHANPQFAHVKLAGATTLAGGFPVELKGAIHANRCILAPKPSPK